MFWTRKEKALLLSRYEAFYRKTMEGKSDGILSEDKLKAIGQHVLEELFDQAMAHNRRGKSYRDRFKKKLARLIATLPDNLSSTGLKWDPAKGFSNRESDRS